MTWPIFDGDRFVGVYDRLVQHVLLFERGEHHGSQQLATIEGGLDAPEIAEHCSPYALDKLREDLELLDVGLGQFDRDAFMAGTLSPAFFGSALTNFGVEPFLREFVRAGAGAGPARHDQGRDRARRAGLRGLRVQDPGEHGPEAPRPHGVRARRRGRYAAGMEVQLTRTGKTLRLAAPQQLHGARAPGDRGGVAGRRHRHRGPGTLRIGDTLLEQTSKDAPKFSDIPRFPPEHFVRVLAADPMRRKQLDTGLQQLSEEGAAQVFFSEADAKLGSARRRSSARSASCSST